MDKDRLELMAAELVASGQYKIMRKFVPRENFGELQGERRGYEFYYAVAGTTADAEIRAVAKEFVREEA